LAQFFFSVAPIWMVEAAVGLLGPFAKHLAFLGCLVLYLIALTAAAFGFLQVTPPRSAVARRLAACGFAASVYLLTLIIIIPILGGGIAGQYLRQGALATSATLLLTHAVYAASLMAGARAYLEADKTSVAQSKL